LLRNIESSLIMNPKITVLVPIYNSEEYLEDCLQSLSVQNYSDFIVYLINDGSTDGTISIINNFIKKDARFKLIDKINTGISSTRNLALNLSKTKYTIFIDSDDTLDSNYLKFLYEKAESGNYHLTYCDYNILDGVNSNKKIHGELSVDASIRKMLLHQDWAVLWNKLFITKIYQDNKIYFPDGINMWEDLFFNIIFYENSSSIGYVPHSLYNYIMRSNGLVKSPIKKSRVLDQIFIISILEKNDILRKKFPDELVFSKAYATKSLITNKNCFDPDLWRRNNNSKLYTILKLKLGIKYKILSTLAFFHMDFIIRVLFFFK
ncbi:glycosyltransferase family 2 protein, partial [Rosenbergiella collisarenosi]|uniref:glycosyltransferase family 2 protein n=1 Tax=Rosenbergiella collisarenosi TaxID=1544695 RepID=UPI001F4FE868